MPTYYKAVRASDHTSHYDRKTLWEPGKMIVVPDADPRDRPCGVGLHCSPTLLDAVGYQAGPSEYCEVEPGPILGRDDTKVRSASCQVVRFLPPEEVDDLAGFRLWEANHAVHPLKIDRDKSLDILTLLKSWASVRDSVWASVRASVGDSVWDSVGDSVWDSVWASVGDSVGDSVGASVRDSMGASVWDSMGAYCGSLFPAILEWKYALTLGADPWRPLRTLWLGGYVPSFDGKKWRLHAGVEAAVVLEVDGDDLKAA